MTSAKKLISAVSKIAAIVIIVIVVAIGAVAAYEYSGQQTTQSGTLVCSTCTVCNNCFVNEPVVDVVIPALIGNSGAAGSTNAPLNVTQNDNVKLAVEIFPSQTIDVKMSFKVLSSPASAASGALNATFNPSLLTIASQSHASTTLDLKVASGASIGVYDVAVSALDTQNSSWAWGTVFNVNVTR